MEYTKEQFNGLRCYANEIILKLFKAKELGQLEILKMYVDRSIEDLKKGTEGE